MSQAKKQFAKEFAESRVDLRVENDSAVLVRSTWTEGIGWSTQKTIRLNADDLDQLHRQIAAARCKLRPETCEESRDNVIKFPAA